MQTKQKKQLSYISIIVLMIASTIGAGIFFKNSEIIRFSQGQIGWVLATWGVAIFGMIALGLALIEVSSAQKSEGGVLEWTKLFTPKFFHKSSRNYVKFIFVPITMLTMPLYVTSTFEDAGWEIKSSWLVLLVSFGIFMWFMITNLISLKAAEISQWITTAIQFLPLIILPIIAFIHAGQGVDQAVDGNGATININIINKDIAKPTGLTGATPFLAMFAGFAAIAFAYDGFYTVTNLEDEIGSPKRMGMGIILGIASISIIYLFLTIAFNVGSSTGDHTGIVGISDSVRKLFDLAIAFGIMGIVNGYALSAPRQLRSLSNEGEANEINWLQKIIYKDKVVKGDKKQLYFTSWMFILIISIMFYITLGFVGAGAYKRDSWDAFDTYGTGTYLYSFADALVNFTSLLMFAIIATTVLGALINRKRNTVKVTKFKYFVPFAWIAVTMFYVATAYQFITSIVDLSGFNGASWEDSLINLSFMVTFVAISTITAGIEMSIQKRRVKV